jgi:IS30 family transposase
MHYTQLTSGQRYQIEALLKLKTKRNEIARILTVHPATIGRELKRNTGLKGYRPKQAQSKTDKRRQEAVKVIKLTSSMMHVIDDKLQQEWSPEQISGWLKKEETISLSHERIYQHVWTDKRQGGDLHTHLRQSNKRRKKKYGSQDKRGQIRNRVSIDERPDSVAQKERIGDWEIDLVIGRHHQGALVTIVERKSKFTLIKKVPNKQAEQVSQATVALLTPYIEKTHTITADNGKEFAAHELIAKALNANIYFAHPYSSWERGLNENTNGLIRQYFTKGSSFETITDEEVERVMEKLNHRPRKTLNFKTPHEVFFDEIHQKEA